MAKLFNTGRQEETGSIPSHTCRPNRSDFSVVFLRNYRTYGLGSFRKTSTGGIPLIVPGPSFHNLLPLRSHVSKLHLRRSGSALKNGRREVTGSIPDRACQPNFSEFSVVFSETRVNTS